MRSEKLRQLSVAIGYGREKNMPLSLKFKGAFTYRIHIWLLETTSFLYIFPWKTAALNWICFADILNVWRLKCDVRQFFAVWNPLWMAKSQMFHDVPLFYINHPKNRLNWLCLMVNSQFLVANLPSDCWIQAECAVESPVSLRRWPHLVGFYGQGSLGMSENGLYPQWNSHKK